MSAPNVAAAELWMRELAGSGDPERVAQLVRELTRELATLEEWLARAWDWFRRNESLDGTPEFAKREDVWIKRLEIYERVSQAVAREQQVAA